jgi:hypothetical protein
MSILTRKYPVRLSFFGSHYLKFNFKDFSDSYLNNTVEGLADSEASSANAAPYFNQPENYLPILENEPLDHDTGLSGASREILAYIGIDFNPFM